VNIIIDHIEKDEVYWLVAYMAWMGKVYRILVTKSEDKRSASEEII
jgi:hypothetical protein